MFGKHKSSSRNGLREFTLSVLAVLLFAFVATTARAASSDAWVELDAPGIDQAYLAIGAEARDFTHFWLEPVGFWHLADPTTTQSDLVTEVRDSLTRRVSGLLESAGLEAADAATANADTTLVVRLQIVDLLLHPATHFEPAMNDRFRFELVPGQMTLVGEVLSGNGDTLLRIADSRADAGVAGWDAVEGLLAAWHGQLNAVFADAGLPSSDLASAAVQ
ncbi:MAG: hypothetical protein AAFX44_08750 [Pseudomonadota bacterium]